MSKVVIQKNPVYLCILLILFLITGGTYFSWRINAFNHDAMIFSWIFFLAELYGFLMVLSSAIVIWRLTIRKTIPPEKRLMVDVFVPIYNESVNLVSKTLNAAIHMDYPHTTWLLDDGNNPKMKQLAKNMGCKYLARTSNEDAKAGNLNHALKFAKGDFIAMFDADHIPNRKFLIKTLGYFKDKKVAFVQTPQDFYNINSFQHRYDYIKNLIWDEQSIFFKIIQRGKDACNSVFLCGSCVVMRRSALDEIGGFATGTLTEDVHTSIKFHKAGYKSVYDPTSLAFGIAPSTIEPFVTQRLRWATGSMQIFKKENILFSSRLTLLQKFNYLTSTFIYFESWQKAIYYIAPIVTLVFGIIPLSAPVPIFLMFFVPYIVVHYMFNIEIFRGHHDTSYAEQYNLVRFVPFIYSTLTLLTNYKFKFNVTNKDKLQKISNFYVYPAACVFAVSLCTLPIAVYRYFAAAHLPLDVLIITSLWVCLHIYYAKKLMNFVIRKNLSDIKSNADYGVLLSHIAIINVQGKKYNAVAQEISTESFTIKALIPPVKIDTILTGEIYFPNLDLPIKCKVLSSEKLREGLFVIRCKFIWDNKNNLNNMSRFIYGSNHHLIFNHTKEFELTPLEKFFALFRKKIPEENQHHSRWFPLYVGKKPLGVVIQRKDMRARHKGTHYAVLNKKPGKTIFEGRIAYNHLNIRSKFKVSDVIVDSNSKDDYYLVQLQRMRGTVYRAQDAI